MGLDIIVRIFVECISDEVLQKLKTLINSLKYLSQDWISSKQFDVDMKTITNEFPELHFHCVYYSDGWLYILRDEIYADGKTNDIKISGNDLESLGNTFEYFQDKSETENKENSEYSILLDTLDNEIDKIRKECIKEYTKNWFEITYMLPKKR